MQTDLHLGNCGIIRNVRTGALRPTPLFDFGGCFGTSVEQAGIQAVITHPHMVERILVGRLKHLDPSWDCSWYDPHALDGFDRELEQLMLQVGKLSPEYVSVLIELFNRQRAYVDSIIS
jgi:hypothetical protein